ncbi:MAG: hypothetical protein HGA49_07430, partial [Eubacteriaceae bacterium]|nr:hypothetical protein [Eubacteriaceae bacterium]
MTRLGRNGICKITSESVYQVCRYQNKFIRLFPMILLMILKPMGMVGRFTRDMRKRLFYYFYSLVTGDPESAARYLTSLTIPGKGADIEGFRRAASDLYTRWLTMPNIKDFSLAQVILQSVLLAGHYHIQYPGEIILMVKALITIEGVGYIFDPEIDIPTAARKHVRSI